MIGAGAFVASHITIGENVIIGANAVVTKDVPANSIVVGNNVIIKKDAKEKIEYIKQNSPKNFKQSKKLIRTNKRITREYVLNKRKIWELRDAYDNLTSKKVKKEIIKEYKQIPKKYKNRTNWLLWSKLYRFFTFKRAK